MEKITIPLMSSIFLSISMHMKTLLSSILLIFFVAFSTYSQCADQTPQGDCDGDGINNFDDLDDDNDGVLDANEWSHCL